MCLLIVFFLKSIPIVILEPVSHQNFSPEEDHKTS